MQMQIFRCLLLNICFAVVLLFAFETSAVAKQERSVDNNNSKPNVIAWDGRFIAFDNGTVKDTKTGLTWASKDGGKGVGEESVETFLDNYKAGGHTDWRMPTVEELEGLYDESNENKHGYHVTKLIDLTGEWAWCTEGENSLTSFGFRDGSTAVAFFDGPGSGAWYEKKKTEANATRILPVRGGAVVRASKETPKRKDRFVAFENGTVLDRNTDLIWAAKDDGKGVHRDDISTFFSDYRAGGYTNWRLPTIKELKSIYDASGRNRISCITDLIQITDEWVWVLGDKGFPVGFSFFHGDIEGYAGGVRPEGYGRLDYLAVCRALPVRSSK
jgi:hypothetical protein